MWGGCPKPTQYPPQFSRSGLEWRFRGWLGNRPPDRPVSNDLYGSGGATHSISRNPRAAASAPLSKPEARLSDSRRPLVASAASFAVWAVRPGVRTGPEWCLVLRGYGLVDCGAITRNPPNTHLSFPEVDWSGVWGVQRSVFGLHQEPDRPIDFAWMSCMVPGGGTS